MYFGGIVDKYFFEIPGIFVDKNTVVDVVHEVSKDKMLGLVNGSLKRWALSDIFVLNGNVEDFVDFEYGGYDISFEASQENIRCKENSASPLVALTMDVYAIFFV